MKLPFRRNTLLAALAASFITFLIMAATRPEPQTLFVAPDESILPSAPLDRIIPEFDVKNMPFRDAILQLSRQLGVPIRIRVVTMEEAGVDVSAPVTIHLINATAATILDEALRIEDRWGRFQKLTYWKGNDGFEISTENEAVQFTVINRIYFVSDVVQNIVAQDTEHWEPPTGQTYGAYAGPGNRMGPMTPAAADEILIKIIEHAVAEDSWKDNGGLLARYGRRTAAF